jgi:hypothetical protein
MDLEKCDIPYRQVIFRAFYLQHACVRKYGEVTYAWIAGILSKEKRESIKTKQVVRWLKKYGRQYGTIKSRLLG